MSDISDEAVSNRATLAEIKRMYMSGEITRDQAKELASPILKRINKKAAEIAKRHNKKVYQSIDFVSAMRSSW
jgi:polyhydroxyalkanoate synthesis regulator phasin